MRQADSEQMDRWAISTGLLAQLLLLATLVSCRSDPPDSASAPPPAATTASRNHPRLIAGSDTSAPAARSPQPDQTHLTPDGWGPLQIGMSRAEVVSAVGEDENPDAAGGPDPERCDEFHPGKAPAGILVMIEDGVLTRVSVSRNPEIATPEGFSVGDSASRVIEAYGSRAEVDRHQYWPDPAKYITVWRDAPSEPDRRGIRYEIDSAGIIVHIRAGARSIEFVEGCL